MGKQISKAPPPIAGSRASIHKPTIAPIAISRADYETWCKADLWTVERGILLLLNVETLPESHPGWMRGRSDLTKGTGLLTEAVYDDFMKIWAVVKSSLEAGVLKTIDRGSARLGCRVLPKDFIKWAKSKDYPIPAELEMIDSITENETVGNDPRKEKRRVSEGLMSERILSAMQSLKNG